MLLHHLHHLANGARHVSRDDGRGVRQTLRDADFTDVFLEFLLEPEAERSDIVLRYAVTLNRILLTLRAKIFLDLVKVGLRADKFLSLVVSNLLE